MLGASIFGAHAGELALLWVVAIEKGLKLHDLAQIIAPYPTWGEIDKAAAWEFQKPSLSKPAIRAAMRISVVAAIMREERYSRATTISKEGMPQ